MFLSHITLDSTTTTGFYMPATAFSPLPRTTSCFNFFSFAASLLVWNGMLSCAVYALRARRSLLPGANINCRNSIYDNVSLPNVGVFDYLKSAPPGTPCHLRVSGASSTSLAHPFRPVASFVPLQRPGCFHSPVKHLCFPTTATYRSPDIYLTLPVPIGLPIEQPLGEL
jgi:hypothetical protein